MARPSPNPYTALKARLLTAYELTNIKQVELLFNLPPLGKQKPSELLAEMIRLCPNGEENNTLFNYLFLTKLPRELCVLLSEADMTDKQAFAARADTFAAHHQKLAHDVVAAVAPEPVQQEDDWVAAVRPGGSQRGGGSRPQRGDGKKKAGCGGGRKPGAKKGSGLCYRHYWYGAGARSCEAPCSYS